MSAREELLENGMGHSWKDREVEIVLNAYANYHTCKFIVMRKRTKEAGMDKKNFNSRDQNCCVSVCV